jgi:hypothetical protein
MEVDAGPCPNLPERGALLRVFWRIQELAEHCSALHPLKFGRYQITSSVWIPCAFIPV